MTVSFGPRQLVLALDHAVSYARDDFLSGPSNVTALALVERWPDWPNRVMVLIGPEGAGKSHLAAMWAEAPCAPSSARAMWAEASGARVLAASLLTEDMVPAALATGALVLEDLEGDALDERALFHLLNLAREEGADLLITARTHPAGFGVGIRDLASRLRALPGVALAPPDDDLLRLVMVKLAADRQIALDQIVVSYVANRIERSFAAARAAVLALDEESMRRHRPITRALAAELFRDPGP